MIRMHDTAMIDKDLYMDFYRFILKFRFIYILLNHALLLLDYEILCMIYGFKMKLVERAT